MSAAQHTDRGHPGYRTLNPATGELLREFPTATDEEAGVFLAEAHEAFLVWRETSPALRASLMAALADAIDANGKELARLTTLEMGKPLAQADFEVSRSASMFRYYAEKGEALLADLAVEVPGFTRAITRKEPLGVVLGIEPWNGPLYQAMRATAPNLMLGNTVLLKPSEVSPGSTSFLDHLFDEVGFPSHVYRTALVSAEQVSTYIADPRVRAITLTGSDRAGSLIARQAGEHIKPVVLELGGSDPFIVLESADAAKAAATASTCRLANNGQICCSPKRLILTAGVADSFIPMFVDAFGNQKIGDPFDPETTMGPLSTQAAVDNLQAQMQDAIDKGAEVLLVGGAIDGPGSFFAPAVLSGVTPDMRLYREEPFGPLALVFTVPDSDAAIELANSSPYGLGGTVFGESDEALQVANRLDIGSVGINAYMGARIEIPFGGTKRSGFGRELGASGMDQFANVKTYGIA